MTDTGSRYYSNDPVNVYCAPDAQSGVFLSYDDKSAHSFLLPSMTPVSTRRVTEGFNPISGAMAVDGTKFFARSASGSDVDAYAYDPSTAVLGPTPLYSVLQAI